MNDFTHGIIVIDPLSLDEDDNYSIIHFCGYWNEPTEQDIENLKEELKTDVSFGLTDIADRLDYAIAPEEILEMYRDIEYDEDLV